MGGAAILGVLVWRVGAGPFLDGLRLTTGWAAVTAMAITSLITVACAWRWRLVAGGLGVDLPLPAAIGACYRSEFLNAVLPGGVLGDVHRGVRHGRSMDDLSRGLRAVAWERTAGQTVQIALTAGAVLAVISPRGAVGVLVLGLIGAAAVTRMHLVRQSGTPCHADQDADTRPGSARLGRLVGRITGDLRDAVLTRRGAPGIVLASVLALAGHVTVFVVAVRVAGVELPAGRLLLLALVVLQAAALPTSIAGWGPREGVSAWAFGVAGLGAAAGVTVAVVYGVLALLATLPGAVLLLADRRAARGSEPGRAPGPVGAALPAWRRPTRAAPSARLGGSAGLPREGGVHA